MQEAHGDMMSVGGSETGMLSQGDPKEQVETLGLLSLT